MKKNHYLITFLVFLFSIPTGMAQDRSSLGFGFNYGTPQGLLSNTNYKDGLGLYVNYISKPIFSSGPIHFSIGGDLEYLGSGRNKYDLETIDPIDGTAEVKYRNRSTGVHLIGRLSTQVSKLQVYGDVIVGNRNFKSDWSLRVNDDPVDEFEQEYETLTRWSTFRYGVGFGLIYQITNSVGIESRVAYTIGDKVMAYDLSSMHENNNVVCYHYETSSRSDMLFANLGVTFKLGRDKDRTYKGNPSGSNTSVPSTTTTTSPRTTRTRVSKPKRVKRKAVLKPGTPEKKPAEE